jgi:hypothetical protein
MASPEAGKIRADLPHSANQGPGQPTADPDNLPIFQIESAISLGPVDPGPCEKESRQESEAESEGGRPGATPWLFEKGEGQEGSERPEKRHAQVAESGPGANGRGESHHRWKAG